MADLELDKEHPSWSGPTGDDTIPNLVGQIFFRFDGAELDDQDRSELDYLCDAYRIFLPFQHQKVRFRFIGKTDYIGKRDYNKELGRKRAMAVKDYVDKKLGAYPTYESEWDSRGEKDAGRDHLAFERRVDIRASLLCSENRVQYQNHPVGHVVGTYSGTEFSKEFIFKMFRSGTRLIFAEISIGVISLREHPGLDPASVRLSDFAESGAFYKLSGVGGSITGSISPIPLPDSGPSDAIRWKFASWLKMDDFEGSGGMVSLQRPGESGTVLQFNGPKANGRTDGSVSVTFIGSAYLPDGGFAYGWWKRSRHPLIDLPG